MPHGTSTRLLHYLRRVAEAGEVGELPDRELVQRFADAREEAAFAALIRRYGAMVLGVCRRVLDHEQDAEDVFQAVFLVLSRKAGTLRRKEAVGPWLFGVARRLALRARRQGRNRRAREARVGARPPDNVLEELTVREAQLVLDEELARLPERERGPLVLCYLQGLTRDEAAQRLGCPLGTLKSRLDLEKGDKGLTTKEVWRGDGPRLYMSTPILHGDLLFGFSEQKLGHLFCLDAKTGKTLWQSDGRLGGYNADYAALLNLGRDLMVLTCRGQLLIVRISGQSYESLAHYRVSDTATYAHPVFLGDRILIKDAATLKSFRLEPDAAKP